MTTLVIDITEDAWIAQDDPATNTGASATLSIKRHTGQPTERVTLLRADLNHPDLTTNPVTILSATLTLTNSDESAAEREYAVYEMASDEWTEAGVTWQAQDGGAGLWAAGDFSETDLGALLGSWTYAANTPAGTAHNVSLSQALVEGYIGRDLDIAVTRVSSGSGASPTFRSSDSSVTAERPTLTIVYQLDTDPPLTAATYYLAPALHATTPGDDSRTLAAAQNPATPWATFAHALKQLDLGDTLIARGGDYVENVIIGAGQTVTATALAPVTVQAYPGEEPWIRGLLSWNDGDYWTFDGINVDGSDVPYSLGRDEVVNPRNAHHWTLRNMEVKSATGQNMQASGSVGGFKALVSATGDGWLIEDCHIHDNPGLHPFVSQDADGNGIYQDHCVYVSGGDGGTIRGCRLYGAPNGRGVKIGNSSSSPSADHPMNTTIENCTIRDTMGPTPIRVSYYAAGHVVTGCILLGPALQDGNGEGIITTHTPLAATTMLTVSDSWGYDASGEATAMVSSGQTDIVDGGGNTFGTDPELDANDVPRNPSLTTAGVIQYGHLAGTTLETVVKTATASDSQSQTATVVTRARRRATASDSQSQTATIATVVRSPAPFTPVTVTHAYTVDGGAAGRGSVRFLLAETITDAAGGKIVVRVEKTVTLPASGLLSLMLLVNAAGARYRVSEEIVNRTPRRDTYHIVIPAATPGGTADLDDLREGA